MDFDSGVGEGLIDVWGNGSGNTQSDEGERQWNDVIETHVGRRFCSPSTDQRGRVYRYEFFVLLTVKCRWSGRLLSRSVSGGSCLKSRIIGGVYVDILSKVFTY
jgi:hypothetical protein